MKQFFSKICLIAMFTSVVLGPQQLFVPAAYAHDNVTSIFLLLDDGSPITDPQDIRLSLWSDGRLRTGDIDGLGALNGAAVYYAGYQTVVTMTPDAHGRVRLALGSLPSFPLIAENNQFLMVEYKDSGDPDTAYVIYDDTYVGSTMDRFPLIVNGPEIFQELYDNDASTANTFTLDHDNTGGDVVLQFGQTLSESLRWNDAQNYFEFSDALVVGGNLNVNSTITRLDADNVGAGANVDIIAEQGSDADGTLRYDATANCWQISNDGGPFECITSGTGDFEDVYSNDGDDTLTTGNGILTFDTGTSDFVVNSNDWNVTAGGDLDAASITSNGSLTASGTTSLNGVANIGDGGDDVAIDSNDWDVSSAGVGSGFTGFTSTGFVNFSGTAGFRIREVADEAAATCTTVKEVVLDTTENNIYVCTVTGAPGTWVAAAAGDASTLDTIDSTQFIRSDTSDNFTSGTLTFDGGTTLTTDGTLDVNGSASLGDGGDDISINSDDWDISSAGVVSGLTGVTSTGSVDLNGTSALRLRENADPAGTAACTTANEVIVNTTLNRLEICTVPGGAGAATWIAAPAGDASTLGGFAPGEYLRSNTSDNFTSGTLTLDNGTVLVISGTATIGDGGDDIAINSDDWDISSAGIASGFTGLTSTGTVNLSGTGELRVRESSDPSALAACTTANEVIVNTTLNRFEICTVPGVAGAATWIVPPASDADTLDSLDSAQFIRSDASDSYTSGTLTLENGTTLSVNGTANIGDGGDDISINSNDWDISSGGVASGLTGITSTGTVNLSGATELRIRESTDPSALAACTTLNEIILNTTFYRIETCTATGIAGAATWTPAPAGDASTFGGLTTGQFLRSDTSDSFTSGTLTTANGTTLSVEGTAALGDGGDDISINSDDWDISSAGVASGLTGVTSTGSVNFSGASAQRIRESTDPSTLAACTTASELIMNTTLNRIEICTVPGGAGAATWVVAPAGSATDLSGITASQFLRSDTSDTFTSGTLTTDNGTTLTVNGTANIGDGGDNVSINSDDWDISSAGIATGFTGITSSGSIDFSAASQQRLRESANPTTSAACTTAGEVIMNTTLNRIEICTVPGGAGAATWVVAPAGDATTFGGLVTGDFLRSNTSDNYSSGTLTFDSGTTLTANGVVNIGDGGDNVAIDSNDWDISSSGVASGFAGITTTGIVDFSGTSSQRIRESTNPSALAACTSANEIIINTSSNRIEVCTVPGVAGAATWVVPPASDSDTLDSLDSAQFIRSDTSDNYTSGTLTFDGGTTLTTDGTLDVNGSASIGDGGDDISIDSNDWDISSGGVASGFTGITSTGDINFSGASSQRIRESANPTTSAACTAANEIIINTSLNRIEVCTVPGVAGAATWVVPPASNADTLDSLDSTQFMRSDASDNYTSGTMTFDAGTTLTTNGTFNVNGAATIGDGGDAISLNSSDWDISATGDLSGIGSITADGLLTGTAGATLSGATLNFNASSSFDVNIATGSSTGAVSIGGGNGTLAINTTSWDVTSGGAASGFTTFDASGNITTSGGDIVIGTTGLSETTSATDSGAFKIGVFDEFTNSNSTTVQDVLDDLDAVIGSNAPNTEVLVFYPEYPNTVIFEDGSNNNGTLESFYDDTNDEHYYQWRSNNATTQDITLKFRFALPADMVSIGDLNFRFRTGTTTEADNDVEVTIFNATDETSGNPTSCAADTTNTSANAWTTATITAASIGGGCTGGTTLNAGDVVEIQVQLYDNSGAGDFANIGFITLDYSN